MEHIHSIILVKKENKYLNYYDDRWDMYLFPNMKGNDLTQIKEKYKTNKVKFLFDKIHEKYSLSHNEKRVYHHYFYEVDGTNFDGEYFSLDELLKDPKIRENNKDIIDLIKEYYK